MKIKSAINFFQSITIIILLSGMSVSCTSKAFEKMNEFDLKMLFTETEIAAVSGINEDEIREYVSFNKETYYDSTFDISVQADIENDDSFLFFYNIAYIYKDFSDSLISGVLNTILKNQLAKMNFLETEDDIILIDTIEIPVKRYLTDEKDCMAMSIDFNYNSKTYFLLIVSSSPLKCKNEIIIPLLTEKIQLFKSTDIHFLKIQYGHDSINIYDPKNLE